VGVRDVTGDRLVDLLARRGWRAAILPLERLADLRAALADSLADMNPGVREVVARNVDLGLDLDALGPGARSLVVAVVPHACARATVSFEGRLRDVPIPTTYCHHREIQDEVLAAVSVAVAPAGRWAALARVPEKLVAACAGLARYGRNNVAYAAGCGSFCELAVCATDLPPNDDPWTGSRLLPRCETCWACWRACPTGAIDADRFLLHGDRCLTLYNESERPFPGWIDPAWHHSLWGCLRCQRCCPEDLATRDDIAEAAAFDERETALLLAGVGRAVLAREAGLRAKLGELGLLAYDDDFLGTALARNLRAALANG
jgi:epoxyqueuosine reductase